MPAIHGQPCRYLFERVGVARPTADNFDRSFVTSDLAFVVAPLSWGGGEAENSWTRNYQRKVYL